MQNRLKQLLEFKPSNRKWDFPIVAGLCVGIPILVGYYTGLAAEGKLASLAGLVILYAQTSSITATMVTLMACSFGIMFSFLVGSLFSFNPYIAALALSVFAFVLHWTLYYLRMTRPPGNILIEEPTALIMTRFYDILTGSIIGAIGGWVLYNERVHYNTRKQVRKAKVVLGKRR